MRQIVKHRIVTVVDILSLRKLINRLSVIRIVKCIHTRLRKLLEHRRLHALVNSVIHSLCVHRKHLRVDLGQCVCCVARVALLLRFHSL